MPLPFRRYLSGRSNQECGHMQYLACGLMCVHVDHLELLYQITNKKKWLRTRFIFSLSSICQLLKHATFKSGPKTCVIRHHPLWCGNQCKHEVLMNGIYSETGWFDTLNPSHTLLRYLSGWTKTGTGPLATVFQQYKRPKDDILLGSKVLVQ